MAKHAKRYKKYNEKKKNLINKHIKKRNNKINLSTILLVIFVIIFIVSGIILLTWYINTGKSEEKYIELAEQVITVNEDNTSSSIIDFNKLREINPDIIAWIKIDGTNINYPIMKTTDNDYYLSKNFYKENDISGSLFLDYRSNFTDKNIVVYGHNIKRGTMFSDLEKILNNDLGNNINIIIYMPDKTMKFKVFSTYKTNPEDYAINTSINEENLDEFAQNVKQRSSLNFECEYANSSQILTLSTCDRTGKKRVLVHAALDSIEYN